MKFEVKVKVDTQDLTLLFEFSVTVTDPSGAVVSLQEDEIKNHWENTIEEYTSKVYGVLPYSIYIKR